MAADPRHAGLAARSCTGPARAAVFVFAFRDTERKGRAKISYHSRHLVGEGRKIGGRASGVCVVARLAEVDG
jgi:hypothetical protein